MLIIQDEVFKINHLKIIEYIALDSKRKAKNFNSMLLNTIKNLPNMPFKFRKSYYFNDAHVRDLIFKGYTIPYLIDESSHKIVLLDIFKWSER
ncbi:MAG: type II toxin-antitoxin system RelE/ParE family toxin [Arcobacteraceae bacterium]|nr:type II toxin-antitoxin system RelE/ParE family toxin [Arcobacteraceae bacterium]